MATTGSTRSEEQVRVPFVIGATGHRKLHPDDLPALRAALREELSELFGMLPHTPVRVLTSLAEGADRMVAEVALKLQHPDLRIVAVLPMPAEAYARDFDVDSAREFERLRAACSSEVVMPPLHGREWDDASLEALDSSDEQRAGQYLTAGAWIVRHCSLLVALWDGRPAQGRGGTAQVVSAMRLGISARGADVSLDPADVGPVIHVKTRRAGDDSAPPERRVQRLLPELLLAARETELVASDNLSRACLTERVGAHHLERANARLAAMEAAPKPAGHTQADDPGETPYTRAFAAFDALAEDARDERAELVKKMVRFALASILLLSAYDLFATMGFSRGLVWTPLLLVPCALSAWIAWRLFQRAQVAAADVTRADYRALAESLRVQRCWWLAGLSDQVADHYLLRQQPSETLWLRLALRALSVDLGRPPPATDCDRLRSACEIWVAEQRDFFYRRALSEERGRKEMEHNRRKLLSTAGGLLAALFLLHLVAILGSETDTSSDPDWAAWLGAVVDLTLFGIAALAAVAAAKSRLLESLGTGQHAQTYTWGAARFKLASERLDGLIACGDVEHARDFLLQLGRLALEENGVWLLAQRARPLEAPELS